MPDLTSQFLDGWDYVTFAAFFVALSVARLVSRGSRCPFRRLAHDAGPSRYCLMISEEVPSNWESTIPLVLETLDAMADA